MLLLSMGITSVTTLFTILYSFSNPGRLPGLFAQSVKITNQISADIKRRVSTVFGGKAAAETDGEKTGAETSTGSAEVDGTPVVRNSESASASAVQTKGVKAVNSGERRTLVSDKVENGTRKNLRRSNTTITVSGSGALPKSGLLVPPPPPTPYVLAPTSGYLQPALQQQQAHAQGSSKTHNPAATPDSAEQSAALNAADQEEQAAMNASLHKNEWTR